MSGEPSETAPNNTGAPNIVPVSDKSTEQESKAIATVETALIKSGVRPEKASNVARVVMTQVASYHSGPLPTVKDFAGYEQICAGAARDILDMAKAEQRNDYRIKLTEVVGDILLKAIGMLSAIAVIGGMMFSAVYAAMNGHEGLAVTIASGSGLALVSGVFVRMLKGEGRKAAQQKQPGKQKPRRRT